MKSFASELYLENLDKHLKSTPKSLLSFAQDVGFLFIVSRKEPDDVFENGFKAAGTNTSITSHFTNPWAGDTAFIATSSCPNGAFSGAVQSSGDPFFEYSSHYDYKTFIIIPPRFTMNLYSLTKDYTNQEIPIQILEQDTGKVITESKILKGGGYTESDQLLAVEKEHIIYGDLIPKRVLAAISGNEIHVNHNYCKDLLNEFCGGEKQQNALSEYRKKDIVSTALTR